MLKRQRAPSPPLAAHYDAYDALPAAGASKDVPPALGAAPAPGPGAPRDTKRRRVAAPALSGEHRGWRPSASVAYSDDDEDDAEDDAAAAAVAPASDHAPRFVAGWEYAAANSVLHEAHARKQRRLGSPPAPASLPSTASSLGSGASSPALPYTPPVHHAPGFLPEKAISPVDISDVRPLGGGSYDGLAPVREGLRVKERYEDANRFVDRSLCELRALTYPLQTSRLARAASPSKVVAHASRRLELFIHGYVLCVFSPAVTNRHFLQDSIWISYGTSVLLHFPEHALCHVLSPASSRFSIHRHTPLVYLASPPAPVPTILLDLYLIDRMCVTPGTLLSASSCRIPSFHTQRAYTGVVALRQG
jgi:hypothetical protein